MPVPQKRTIAELLPELRRVKRDIAPRICFTSYINAASKALHSLRCKMMEEESSTGEENVVLPEATFRDLIEEGAKDSNMEESVEWMKKKYQMAEHCIYDVVERRENTEEYDPNTSALITVIKLDRESLKKLECATLAEVAKSTPNKEIKVDEYKREPGGPSWELVYKSKELTLKKFATAKVGYGRDYDLRASNNYGEIEKAVKETFKHLAPLNDNDLCKGVVAGDGITTPYAYFKGSTLNYTRPHIESAGLLSVNLNITGEPSTWYNCSPIHWDRIVEMVEERGMDPKESPFWPQIEDLEKEGIEVFEVEQKAGEAIIVNNCCVHWVQGKSSSHISWNLFLPGYKQLLGFALATTINQSYAKDSDIAEEKLLWNFVEKNNIVTDSSYCCDSLLIVLAMASLMHIKAITNEIDNMPEVTIDELFDVDPDWLLKCDNCHQELFFASFSDGKRDFCLGCSKAQEQVQPHLMRDPRVYTLVLQELIRKHMDVQFEDVIVKEEEPDDEESATVQPVMQSEDSGETEETSGAPASDAP